MNFYWSPRNGTTVPSHMRDIFRNMNFSSFLKELSFINATSVFGALTTY